MSNPVKRSKLSKHINVDAQEIRNAHIKTAVYPSEKSELELMVRATTGKSMSDYLRDHLLARYARWKLHKPTTRSI